MDLVKVHVVVVRVRSERGGCTAPWVGTVTVATIVVDGGSRRYQGVTELSVMRRGKRSSVSALSTESTWKRLGRRRFRFVDHVVGRDVVRMFRQYLELFKLAQLRNAVRFWVVCVDGVHVVEWERNVDKVTALDASVEFTYEVSVMHRPAHSIVSIVLVEHPLARVLLLLREATPRLSRYGSFSTVRAVVTVLADVWQRNVVARAAHARGEGSAGWCSRLRGL